MLAFFGGQRNVKFDRSMMLQIVESGRAGQMIQSFARMILDARYKIVGEANLACLLVPQGIFPQSAVITDTPLLRKLPCETHILRDIGTNS